MKKIICVILVMVIMVSFFGCTSNDNVVDNTQEIKIALVGTWGIQTETGEFKSTNMGWVFNADGTASYFSFGTEVKGTYVIEEDKIILTYGPGDSTYFIYSFSNGELKLKSENFSYWNMWKQ